MTLSVPEAWRDEVSSTMIGVLLRSIRHLDDQHEWRRPGGDVWINVSGVAEGSIGLDGTAATANDVVAYMTEEFRAAVANGAEVPDGFVVDPMCGMRVRLGPGAITLEHGGTTLGFCAHACRAAYAHHEGIPSRPESLSAIRMRARG
jgi:YHS domain-containing protein